MARSTWALTQSLLSPKSRSIWCFRYISVTFIGLLCDLLWSDPDKDITGWSENDRGVSFTFGPDVVSRFLQKHDMDLICRAHQVRFILLALLHLLLSHGKVMSNRSCVFTAVISPFDILFYIFPPFYLRFICALRIKSLTDIHNCISSFGMYRS